MTKNKKWKIITSQIIYKTTHKQRRRIYGKVKEKTEIYRKIKLLGKGGDGCVYLVEHIPTEQLRAAKIRKKDGQERLRELNMLKRLRHSSLPHILDLFETEEETWLILDYIHGTTLEQERCQLTPAQFFSIAGQLTDVVAYLHSRQAPVLHLDIKPSNIILKPDGHIILLDFGAAVFKKEGAVCLDRCYGTPGFAAPEQMQRFEGGTTVRLDERADIYGAGATLYYCLTGSIPGPSSQNTVSPDLFYNLWKRHIFQILDKCLKDDSSDRFADITELQKALGRQERFWRYRKLLRSTSGAACILLFLLLFSFYAVWSDTGTSSADSSALEERYEEIMQRAEASGIEQSLEYYRQAAELYPDHDWYLRFADRIFGDYEFTADEEKYLQSLLYETDPGDGITLKEHMKKNAADYFRFAYRTGISYWYFYEGAGGKGAAVRWFAECIAENPFLPEEERGFQKNAKVYSRIGSYYDAMGKTDETGRKQDTYADFWSDLKELWSGSFSGQDSEMIQKEIAKELYSCVTVGAYELRLAGESKEDIKEILFSARQVFQTLPDTDEQEREVTEKAYRDAEAAVERAFAGERSLNDEKKKETE